ncbi:MAG: hypothetical protein Q9220_000859 [cf. Caloplaca sp. 1 TL-2023]
MEEGEEEEAGLTLLGRKTMSSLINPNQAGYCPTMDLLALGTADEHVHVFRSNGQRVFGVSRRGSRERITALTWKPDGKVFLSLLEFEVLDVQDCRPAHTGKVMYEKSYLPSLQIPISCLGWASNATDPLARTKDTAKPGLSATLDDVISSYNEANHQPNVPDLPTELAFIDIASVLPKLSTLPIGGSEGDIFSSRASLDTLFKPLSATVADYADVLVAGYLNGSIHLSMSEHFSIGTFDLKDAHPNLSGSKPFHHCSHPMFTTHALLVSTKLEECEEISLLPFDLRFISNGSRHLALLASKVTEMHNLLRYLHQTHEQISAEIRASQDLPSKFMRNINEALLEKSDSTWIQAAYHLVVTGHCFPEVKEWLVGDLGERNHKRWDRAVNTGYENVRRLTHESLLPALDRFSVLISRLRGLSRFHSSDSLLGLSTVGLDAILDSVNCLQLLSHQLLKCAGSELQQFGAFSSWLRHEIEKQGASPTSASAQEIAEKDMGFDHISILKYIQGAMTDSRMPLYSGVPDSQTQQAIGGDGHLLFDLYREALKDNTIDGHPPKRLPGLGTVLSHLQNQADSLFESISDSQRKNIHLGFPIHLGAGRSTCVDMRMNGDMVNKPLIYVAMSPSPKEHHIKIFRIELAIENGVSSTETVQYACIPLNAAFVRDLKFVDDEHLMLAIISQDSGSSHSTETYDDAESILPDTARLTRISYTPKASSGEGLKFHKIPSGSRQGRDGQNDMEVSAAGDEMPMATIYRFASGKVFMPQFLAVNSCGGNKRVCVVSEDRLHYTQFDMNRSDELGDAITEVDRTDEAKSAF